MRLATYAIIVAAAWTLAAQTLDRRAVLPADTFFPGPTSGQFIAPANGKTPPFRAQQPVQGVSSILRSERGSFLVMSDNGFGTKENSADFLLRVYRITPRFASAKPGRGSISVASFMLLRDPAKMVPWPIVADGARYPSSSIPVDRTIRAQRLLTGADFDIESFRRAPDGSYWFGDEFGPFLLHTDASGRLLEAPIPLPGVRSPQNPMLRKGETANHPGSRGFEGMAIIGEKLYPILEGALAGDADQRRRVIYEFDIPSRSYTGRRFHYRTEDAAHAIGELTEVSRRVLLVIERDGFEREEARFKRVFLVDLDRIDEQGFLIKREVADLMRIADPNGVGGSGTTTFTFPFHTIESLIPLSADELGVINDNNYPFGSGRRKGEAEETEFIVIRLPRPLSHPAP